MRRCLRNVQGRTAMAENCYRPEGVTREACQLMGPGKSSANRGLPLPLRALGSARQNPKKGAPDTENPSCIGFTVLSGSETMVSDHGL